MPSRLLSISVIFSAELIALGLAVSWARAGVAASATLGTFHGGLLRCAATQGFAARGNTGVGVGLFSALRIQTIHLRICRARELAHEQEQPRLRLPQ
ncbi:hypothetical protein ASE35_09330 [Lysobacter sp. Root916]|nr:hypothetical protein ASE35_09330 [Lysobacter sp. Root916]